MGAGLQPSVVAVVVNLVVPELAGLPAAGKFPLQEMEIVELPSSAWPKPLAGVEGKNLAHEGKLVGRQITLPRAAGQRLVGSNFFQVAFRHPFTKILLGPT